MTKRVKKQELFERFYRHRIVQYGLFFDFTTPSPNARFGVTLIGPSTDEEKRSYEIRFNPPIEKIHGSSSYLNITHATSKRMDTVLTILPKTTDKKLQVPFVIFSTHVVRIEDEKHVVCMYLTIVNNQLRGDIDTPIWQPHFNMQFFMGRNVKKYLPLDFFDPEYKGPTDVSKIPQGSFIAAKVSYGLTSSRSGKLLGFFPGVSDFSGWKAVSMRTGRLYEPVIAGLYLKHHPEYTFNEIGFTSFQNGSEADGAQIDGLINGEFAVEFKSSKFNCDFEPSYISQCILEMACGFPHVDLVKFCERQKKTNDNVWETTYECKEIRIYRDVELEKQVIDLCKQAMKNPKLSETFGDMRSRLQKIAAECNEKATQIPIDLKFIESFRRYKEDTLATQANDAIIMDPVMDRIEKRQARIFAAYQEENRNDFIRETMDQIQDYSELVKK